MLNNFTIPLNDAGGKTAVCFNVHATHTEVTQRAAVRRGGRPRRVVSPPRRCAAEHDRLENNTLESVQINEIGLSVRLTRLLMNNNLSMVGNHSRVLNVVFLSDLWHGDSLVGCNDELPLRRCRQDGQVEL